MGTDELLGGRPIVSPQSCVSLNLHSEQSSWSKVLIGPHGGEVSVTAVLSLNVKLIHQHTDSAGLGNQSPYSNWQPFPLLCN